MIYPSLQFPPLSRGAWYRLVSGQTYVEFRTKGIAVRVKIKEKSKPVRAPNEYEVRVSVSVSVRVSM